MRSVLISIQPYWAFLIIAKKMGWNINQEKTIEVRKNYPKDENWDKVAKIYCSKDKKSFAKIPKEYQPLMEQLLGKVIGEFVCDKKDRISHCGTHNNDISLKIVDKNFFCKKIDYSYLQKCQLSYPDIDKYSNGGDVYGWHISDLVIYDEPRELGEFYRECEKPECEDCPYLHFENTPNSYEGWCIYDEKIPITRPPQSWCYVESEVERK